MPLVLQRYLDAEKRLLQEGESIKMVAARGPFAVAGWLLGHQRFDDRAEEGAGKDWAIAGHVDDDNHQLVTRPTRCIICTRRYSGTG